MTTMAFNLPPPALPNLPRPVQDECVSKYGLGIYAKFLECFSALPVCAILSQAGQRER